MKTGGRCAEFLSIGWLNNTRTQLVGTGHQPRVRAANGSVFDAPPLTSRGELDLRANDAMHVVWLAAGPGRGPAFCLLLGPGPRDECPPGAGAEKEQAAVRLGSTNHAHMRSVMEGEQKVSGAGRRPRDGRQDGDAEGGIAGRVAILASIGILFSDAEAVMKGISGFSSLERVALRSGCGRADRHMV